MSQETESGVRVLLVDDNELNREMEAAMMEPYGFEIVQAESGQQAVELVWENKFQIIFLDYLMPGMDGLETAERIQELCRNFAEKPAVYALTADESPEIYQAFKERGCDGLLKKPVDEEKLDAVMRNLGHGPELAEKPRKTEKMSAEEAEELKIPGIDLSEIRLKKTKEQYMDLLQLYYEDGKQQLKNWQSVARERVGDYHIWVHALKSASANIGAMALSQEARAQEMAAKAGDYHTIETDFPKLMEDYQVLLGEIFQLLEKEKGAFRVPNEATGPELSPHAIQFELKRALTYSEDFQSKECAQTVERLLTHQLPEYVRKGLEDVRGKLRFYQDDDAEEILRQLLG